MLDFQVWLWVWDHRFLNIMMRQNCMHSSAKVVYVWILPIMINSIILFLAVTKFMENLGEIKKEYLSNQRCSKDYVDQLMSEVGQQNILYISVQGLIIALALIQIVKSSIIRNQNNEERL